MWPWKSKAEAQLSKELRHHFDQLVQDAIAAGVPPEEARRQARLEFGGIEQVKEDCRDVRGRWLEDLIQDLRYAARTLRASPGFLAIAVLSLALGMGANTAIFSLINAVMLQSLPVKEPERLVQVTRLTPNGRPAAFSYRLFHYFHDTLKSVSALTAQRSAGPAIVMDGAEEMVTSEEVSGEHYQLLGLEPVIGRLLTPGDDNTPAAVLSHAYWNRRFGSSPAALGKTFAIRQQVFTIVGVTPARYHGARPGRDPDITIPLNLMLTDEQKQEPTNNTLSLMGRLQPGLSLEQADAEMQIAWQSYLQGSAAEAAEKDRPGILNQRAAVLSASDGFNRLRYMFGEPLLVLMGIVGLVLLLACANLSGMLIARAASRKREIAIRLAIGAGRGRLMRQFLAESFLLAILGGALGLLLASWLSTGLVTMMAGGNPLLLSTEPDWRVLAFTLAISLLACVLAGAAPAGHALRASFFPGLKEVRGHEHHWVGKVLVVTQVGISMILVVVATLFIGTLVKLYTIDRGFETSRILMFGVGSSERYPQTRSWAVQKAIVNHLRTLPGVASASATQVIPLSGNLWIRDIQVEGYTFRNNESEQVGFNVLAPHYFATIGTPLLQGREFADTDTANRPKVAIVNESFARYFFAGQSPLGRHVTSVKVTYEIVGIVKDAKYESLRKDVMKTMYIPWTQREDEQPSSYTFLARVGGGDPLLLVPALEKVIRQADPALRLRTPQTYSTVINRSIVAERLMAALGGFFGVLALIVACLGIFGVMAFTVSRRINEIGVRMALGASRGGIASMVLRETAILLSVGLLLGGAASLGLTGIAKKMLFGVTPTDPAMFAIATATLAGAAFIAGWLPARKASRIDPMVALRHE